MKKILIPILTYITSASIVFGAIIYMGGNMYYDNTNNYMILPTIVATSTPPTVNNCGTGPAVDQTGSKTFGRIYTGRNASGCRVTFPTPFITAPFCQITNATSTNYWYATTTTTTLNLMATGTINVSNGLIMQCGQGS